MEPAVITFRPDNFLTVGLIVLIMFVAAVAVVQIGMRVGLVASVTPPARLPAGAAVVA